MTKTLVQDLNHREQLKCDCCTVATKVCWLIIAVATSLVPTFHAVSASVDQAVFTAPVISSRGPHHRVWTRTNIVTLPNGLTRTNSSSYVELGSGMHRWDPNANQWVDAEVLLEIQGNTAVSRNGAHNVTFAANANTPGAISLVSPDGKTFRSHVLGIAWFDASTSQSEMIAELKDSIGELHPPDTVI